MILRSFLAAVAALATFGITAAAQAEPGYATANVNMRTGPDIDFPSIGVIPDGAPVFIEGCLRDESWCDVRWGPERGWVYSEYLAFDYRGNIVALPDIGLSVFRIPYVTFSARDYWGRYYVGRPWYAERNRWYGYKVRPRPGWRAPPPGQRRAGWWRDGYRAPRGMKAPPQRWNRPHNHRGHDHYRGPDRHDNRGHDHRGHGSRGGDNRGHDHRGPGPRGGDHRGGGDRGHDRGHEHRR